MHASVVGAGDKAYAHVPLHVISEQLELFRNEDGYGVVSTV